MHANEVVVRSGIVGSQVSIDRCIAFYGKNKFLTKFKNYRAATDGCYSNVKENASMLYIVWECTSESIVAVNIDSRMMYYH